MAWLNLFFLNSTVPCNIKMIADDMRIPILSNACVRWNWSSSLPKIGGIKYEHEKNALNFLQMVQCRLH